MLHARFSAIQECHARKTRHADESALAAIRDTGIGLSKANSPSRIFDDGVIAILKERRRSPDYIQHVVVVAEALVEFLRDRGKAAQDGRCRSGKHLPG